MERDETFLLYTSGSQAMGGVVNIITKDANRPFTGNVSVRYGNNDESKYSLSLGTKQGRFSALTSLSYRKRDAYALKDEEGQIEYSYYKDIYGRDSVVADTSEKGMSLSLIHIFPHLGQSKNFISQIFRPS